MEQAFNVLKTLGRFPESLLNFLCTFNLRPMSRINFYKIVTMTGNYSVFLNFHNGDFPGNHDCSFSRKLVGNKAKERISKRVFQENKARQIFRKIWRALFS